LILIAAVALIAWAGLLLAAQVRVHMQLRSVIRWIAMAWLLVESGVLLSMIASQRHWTLHHTTLGAIAFLLPVAGLPCVVMAAVSWRRRTAQRRA
jgi:hypothetical protein